MVPPLWCSPWPSWSSSRTWRSMLARDIQRPYDPTPEAHPSGGPRNRSQADPHQTESGGSFGRSAPGLSCIRWRGSGRFIGPSVTLLRRYARYRATSSAPKLKLLEHFVGALGKLWSPLHIPGLYRRRAQGETAHQSIPLRPRRFRMNPLAKSSEICRGSRWRSATGPCHPRTGLRGSSSNSSRVRCPKIWSSVRTPHRCWLIAPMPWQSVSRLPVPGGQGAHRDQSMYPRRSCSGKQGTDEPPVFGLVVIHRRIPVLRC